MAHRLRHPPTPTPLLHILFVLGLLIVAATLSPLFVRRAQLEGIPTPLIVWLRLALATVSITPFVLRHHAAALRQLSRRELLLSFAAGFWLVCNLLLFFAALEYTGILVTSVLRRTTPLWTALPEVFLLGAIFPRRLWWGIAITMLGGALVAVSGGEGPAGLTGLVGGEHALAHLTASQWGALMALGGAACGAFYYVLGRYLNAHMPMLLYSWLAFAWGGLISGALLLFWRIPLGGYTPAGYGWALSVVIIAQLVGHLAINWSVGKLHATTMSLVMQLSVVASGLLAWAWLAELPLPGEVLGSLIVLVGVTLATLRRPVRAGS